MKADLWKNAWALEGGRGKRRKAKNAARRARRHFEREKHGSFSSWIMRVNYKLWCDVYCTPLIPMLKKIYCQKDIETLAFKSPLFGMLPTLSFKSPLLERLSRAVF